MSISPTPTIRFPSRRALRPDKGEQMQLDGIAADLRAALGREQVLLSEQRRLSLRREMLAQEFEHRLINGMQMVVSLLTLQSRTAASPEAAAQLMIASRRVSALGRVHHRLHQLDQQDKVEFKQYLQQLCEDLSGLLFEAKSGHVIVVEGVDVEIPTVSAIPLGFVLNELITNSAKYAKSHIAVSLETISPTRHSLSVSDDGPGLSAGFEPAKSSGLGMKIIQVLVHQIGGAFQILPGQNGRGVRSTVTFSSA